MMMPGFTAEAALSKDSRLRFRSSDDYRFEEGVFPALTGCLRRCVNICEDDSSCMSWCMCRCRGGRHCPLPM